MKSIYAAPETRAPRTGDAQAIAAGKRVLEIEAAGVTALGRALDGAFAQAIDLLERTRGRVIITGMGKSGHIGRKIAATLASTGAPSQFVHPGEASHGDLGMIQDGDAIIALSNSGETSELSDVVAYAKRYGHPLIAMTGRAGSTLSEAADVALVIPASPEACAIGLAPTTSTTVMLALGDALAVALMERKGFSADDFYNFHPGGKLGNRLLKVEDLMHVGMRVPLLTEDTLMADVLIDMSAKGFGAVGVIDAGGRLKGVITDGDLRRNMSPQLVGLSAREVMTPGGVTARPKMLASEALAVMNARNITALFVEDDNRPVGIVHIHDCLRAGLA
ncbi:KpsF/GutQ family sugar-phosphate isomerase [Varunaivibrio sulfuroxidans]|uniref:Arabinose-5-phosphate isomerase n=1 Tax=Varunaivibrio sulfuroxidans TaxID=1773489 RepID=A0A4R3JHK8_9PROT|nr:KpsF/GutQ family sugar-phosphate isomerase [Varunaivibrio sulfuroxidans]TCS64746.1 arabinose-5-phosphate isomerase [Varunaivibrio sulfuroxidans]WES29949.1 KpsF/GutQ family sugar-phosphate isomerase [Varunaivibrio sulfuroxidans]